MYYMDNGQRSNKLQIRHAERMILPNSSQKYLGKPLNTWELRNKWLHMHKESD